MKELSNSVAAVIVTYEPNNKELAELVDILSSQVASIYIVDNNSSQKIPSLAVDSLVELQDNLGIASAQNIGLQVALGDGFEDFVLFDQDSKPSTTMIDDLIAARDLAIKSGIEVAAVGPVHIDQDSLTNSTFISTRRGKVDKIEVPELKGSTASYAQCDFLIASGCLISQSSMDRVGYMEESLFIDCVDIEWGFRASNKGLHCIAAFDAKMHHKIGDAHLKLFGRDLTTHSPLRHYYFYRNFYSLLKRSYVPSCWKWHTLIKSTIQAVIFSLFLKPRVKQFSCIMKGIFHGLVGRSGRYE